MSLFMINGHSYKVPSSLRGITSTLVDAGRNANGIMVGQKIGRDQYKLDSLQWNLLSVSEWSSILQEFDNNFICNVTFFNPATATWITRKMYCSDRSQDYPKGSIYYNSDGSPKIWLNCKVNVIDTGE